MKLHNIYVLRKDTLKGVIVKIIGIIFCISKHMYDVAILIFF